MCLACRVGESNPALWKNGRRLSHDFDLQKSLTSEKLLRPSIFKQLLKSQCQCAVMASVWHGQWSNREFLDLPSWFSLLRAVGLKDNGFSHSQKTSDYQLGRTTD